LVLSVLRIGFAVLAVLAVLALAGPLAGAGSLVGVTVMTYPERLPVIVDGTIYTPGPGTGAYRFQWEPGSRHTISLLSPSYDTGPGSRLVFTRWNTGETSGSITVAPAESSSYVALYEPYYYVNAESPWAPANGTGWYRSGETATVSVPPLVELGNGTRAVFTGWSGGSTPSMPSDRVAVLGPVTLKAEWRVEHLLSLRSEPGNASLYGAGWHAEGERVTIRAPLEVPEESGALLRFRGWSVAWGSAYVESPSSRETSVVLSGPAVVVAEYDRYYRVRVTGLPGGPVEEMVEEGGTYTLTPPKLTIQTGPGSRLVFAGWSNGQQSPTLRLSVEGPTSVEALWRAEYRVSVSQGPVPVEGAGWYREGSTATLKAPSTYDARLGARYVFQHWAGDASGGSPVLHLKVSAPLNVEPVYSRSLARTALGAAATVIVLVGVLAAYRWLATRLPGAKAPR